MPGPYSSLMVLRRRAVPERRCRTGGPWHRGKIGELQRFFLKSHGCHHKQLQRLKYLRGLLLAPPLGSSSREMALSAWLNGVTCRNMFTSFSQHDTTREITTRDPA